MINKKVYLAGSITGCTYDDCTNWRDVAGEKLTYAGLIAYSPMRGR